MCLYPRIIENKKYRANKKNGGNIPPITDHRVKYVPIGCQQCIECRKQKARSWQIRLLEDIKTYKNGKFVTLTFSDEAIKKTIQKIQIRNKNKTGVYTSRKKMEGYTLDNEIATYATRKFLERWRKKYGTSVRHWFVTEIGGNGTQNIHLHGILWTNETGKTIQEIWQNGYVWAGKEENGKITNYVNDRTIGYITKYVHKIDMKHKGFQSKILTSPGIGHNYTNTIDSKKNKYNNNKTIETYRTNTGHKISLPIYWRNKIYDETEREQLWIQKLDKQIRWVRGEKVSIANGDKEYKELLKYHQARNVELGYKNLNNKQNWKIEQYEKQQRTMNQLTRIKRAERTKIIDSKNAA